MSNPIHFQDHGTFHKDVFRVTIAGAALSLLFYLAGLVLPMAGAASQVILLALAIATMGLAAHPPAKGSLFSSVLLALGIGLLATLSRHALTMAPNAYPWFGVAVYGVALGVIAGRDLRDYRRYLLPVATALSVALATWVDVMFRAGANFTGYVPPFFAEPAHGALFGFLVSIGLLARQIMVTQDPVAEAFDEIKSTLSGEMLELSSRAVVLYQRIQEVLKDRQEKGAETEPDLSRSVQELVMKIISLGPKWNEVEREVEKTSADGLLERLEVLEKKIAGTTDEVARKQYRMAREALQSQAQYLQGISRSRERVMARVHNYLATLERLHLAVINHRGADAAKLSDEIHPILDEIDNFGHEMDFASEAMNEVGDDEAEESEEKLEEQEELTPAEAYLADVGPVDTTVTKTPQIEEVTPKSEVKDAEAQLAKQAFEA